jgi:hypothetical protein|tara:strand:- start:525 stop:839 length:315 start_codon:yes stop_codon:yes gene_type:complete
MARTKQYVTYTREFSKGKVNSKIGVFIEEAINATDNKGNINGGVIKFKNLTMTRPTPTKKLMDAGYDFNVRVLAKSDLESAQSLRNEMISLLSASGRTVINHVA